MCVCTPAKRTPFCGKPGCQWPQPQEPQPERRVGRIRAEIVPWSDHVGVEVRVTVEVAGEPARHEIRRLPHDDFASRFDLAWKHLGACLKETLS